ncbi:histamine H3 receptor-like [Branchiostoma floridae]|uniref:Histamine H3 receptor-like n=1 Tax=Branchiostoma floridae TaxID=7739 RepID=A0A9J7LIA7_BRAFL|nr:histamine H3 receptor-like [Branchiostoma floridae]
MSVSMKYVAARGASFQLPGLSGQSDNVSSAEDASRPEDVFPVDSMVCGAVLSILALFMVAVNGRVILAFILDKKLWYPSNLLVLNLSVSDFLFGLISLPLLTVNQVTGRWVLGQTACSLWQFVTLWMRCESALTVALISFDRYLMVKRAAEYRRKTRRTETLVLVVGSWVLSLVLTGPAVLVWDVLMVNGVVWEERCLTDFVLEAPAYNMFLHTLMLVGPSAIMTFCYLQVVRDLKKRAKRRAKNKSPLPHGAGRFENKEKAKESPEDNSSEKSKSPPSTVRSCRQAKMDVLVTIAETKDKCQGAYPAFAVANTILCNQSSPKSTVKQNVF